MSYKGNVRIWASPEDMDEAIEAFFARCKQDDECPTITGLAVALGMDRRSVTNYHNRPEYMSLIDRAKSVIEAGIEQRLLTSGSAVAGSIFTLKNNFGWRDEKVVESKGEIGVRQVVIQGVNSKDS
jgi:hypothetical protein